MDTYDLQTLHISHDHQGLLLLMWLNFSPTWAHIYILYKVWDEITYPFPNFMNFGNG